MKLIKRYGHLAFYAAAVVATTGMWAKWSWVEGTFDGWFPACAILAGHLTRIWLDAPPTIIDRQFKSGRIEKIALGSLAAMVLGIVLWGSYLKFVHHPQQRAEAIEEFKAAHAAREQQK